MTNVRKNSPDSKSNYYLFSSVRDQKGIFKVLSERKEQHVFSNLPYLTAECFVEIYSNRIRLKLGSKSSSGRIPPERKNNDISKFSVNSRRRMISQLSQINLDSYSTPIFVTLTFHNNYPEKSEEIKKNLRNYLKKVLRKYPELSYVWRIEWQKRKAPHFHIIFFPPFHFFQSKLNYLKNDLKRFWFSYLPDHSYFTWRYSADVQFLKEKKRLFSYISKYTAKVEEESELSFYGQRHGSSRNLNLSAYEGFAVSQKFLIALKKKFWKIISKKMKYSEDFFIAFFDNGEISFIFDNIEAIKVINEVLKEIENP